MVSKRKIDKIGDILKEKESLDASDLNQLLEWRNSFSSTLDYYFSKLKVKIDKNDAILFARRLKRIESIQIKLKRFSTMRLSTLQDIAGLRVILKNEIGLNKAYTNLRVQSGKHKIKKVDDYHNRPKKDGYRGIHLIYQTENSILVEVQLRTELEHIWSTAVETYGELQQASFKTGEGDEKWKEFFKLLSSYFALKENSNPLEEHLKLSNKKILSNLKKYIRDLKVIEKLNAATNNVEVVLNKHNKTGRMGRYALVELDIKNSKTTVEIFNKKDVDKAIQIYTEKELGYKENDSKNIVFVNIDDIENIKKSFPNYFLDTHKLLEILSKIILNEF